MQCPICKKENKEEFAPFCSSRCKAVDLNRWLNGSYAIPDEESPFRHESDDEKEEENRQLMQNAYRQ